MSFLNSTKEAYSLTEYFICREILEQYTRLQKHLN